MLYYIINKLKLQLHYKSNKIKSQIKNMQTPIVTNTQAGTLIESGSNTLIYVLFGVLILIILILVIFILLKLSKSSGDNLQIADEVYELNTKLGEQLKYLKDELQIAIASLIVLYMSYNISNNPNSLLCMVAQL